MDAIATSLATHGFCCVPIKPSPSPSPYLINSHFSHNNGLLALPPHSPARPRSWVLAALHKGRHQHHQLGASASASPGEISSEITEDSKFVPLNSDDPSYGPPSSTSDTLPLYSSTALLLVGFEANETVKIRQLLKDLDGEFLKVIHCTENMVSLTVWDAIHVQQQEAEALKNTESLPRICILSGLSGEEMMMFIDAFLETGLKPAVFAAMVPNSANKLLGEVIEEIMGDHEMVSAKQSS